MMWGYENFIKGLVIFFLMAATKVTKIETAIHLKNKHDCPDCGSRDSIRRQSAVLEKGPIAKIGWKCLACQREFAAEFPNLCPECIRGSVKAVGSGWNSRGPYEGHYIDYVCPHCKKRYQVRD